MFVFTTDVEIGPEVFTNIATKAFKFGVGKHIGDAETAALVDVVDPGKSSLQGVRFAVVKGIGGDEPDVPGESDEKRDPIHKHDVDAEDDIAILSHDGVWDVKMATSVRLSALPGGFAF